MNRPLISRQSILTLLALTVSGLLAVSASFAEETDTGKEAADLIDVLQADLPDFRKAKACYRLAVIGDERAVPALAALLTNENLSNYSRHALERISGDNAKRALRESLDRVEGELLVGVIGSLGHLRDEEAIELLVANLSNDDQQVALASAQALGRIGNQDSATALRTALKSASGSDESSLRRRDSAAAGCILAAQVLAADGNRPLAIEMCDAIRDVDVSDHLRLPALYSAVVLRGADSNELLRQLLASSDWAEFQIAMRAAREMDVDVSRELVAQFDKRDADEQVVLLAALANLGNKIAVPTFLKAARSGKKAVRIAAMTGLVRLGDETAIPVLLDSSRDADPNVAEAARQALIKMPSPSVDSAVLSMLDGSDSTQLRQAIDLAENRLMQSAAEKLWKLAQHDDEEIRLSALRALGTTARAEDWPQLIRVITAEEESAERAAARTAAKTASGRNSPQESTRVVAQAFEDAKPDAQIYLLDLLGQIGGPDALQLVLTAAQGDDESLRDAATRVLGNWATADVAPALYELTTNLSQKKYKIRTLRGYVRVARHLSMPIGERMDLCEKALDIADRSEEKLLVLDVLRVHAVPRGMRIARGMLSDEDSEVMEQAARVIVILARGYVREFPDHAKQALEPALKVAKNERVQTVGQEILTQARELLEEEKSQP